MPFNIGLMELLLLLVGGGVAAAVVVGAVKYLGSARSHDRHLEDRVRDLERELENRERRERLPPD